VRLAAARNQRLDRLEQLRLLVRLAEIVVDADLDGAMFLPTRDAS
jgi:hypothetical protein